MLNYSDLNYTSDHVWRRIDVNKYKGFTWNILEKCYSKNDGPWGFSNNPLGITETTNDYTARKLKQFGEIIELCNEDDFGFLQEADFLFPNYYKNRGIRDKLPDDFTNEFQDLKNIFINSLSLIGFKLITYEERQMAILYSDKLTLIKNSQKYYLKFKFQEEIKQALFCADFLDNITNKVVTLGTIHCDFMSDYSVKIPRLMKKLQSEKMVIFGGDTNHSPSYKMNGLLVTDPDICTHFFSDSFQHKNGFKKINLHDTRRDLQGENIMKAYDGFFVIPPFDKSVKILISGIHTFDKEYLDDGYELPILILGNFEKTWITDKGLPIFETDEAYGIFNE